MKNYFSLIAVTLVFLLIVTIIFASHVRGLNDTEPLHGIDVSHWSGEIDWEDIDLDKVEFVFAKSTEGSTGIDEQFETFKRGAKSAGIPFGAYHFFSTKSDPVEQAQHFLLNGSVQTGSLPPVLDIEQTSGSVSKEQLQKSALIWLQEVESQTGCRPLVYASLSFYNENMGSSLTEYGLWIAKYSEPLELPDNVTDWVFWQYTNDQRIKGVPGDVDLNRFNGSARDLNKLKCS